MNYRISWQIGRIMYSRLNKVNYCQIGNDMWKDMANDINDQEDINDGNNIKLLLYIVQFYLNYPV